MDYKKELQELSSCCGTTCDSKGNLKYVRGLLEYIIQLEEENRAYKATANQGKGRTSAAGGDASGTESPMPRVWYSDRTK